jgi:hypothetical protein
MVDMRIPDEVCADAAQAGTRIVCRASGRGVVLIEGTREGLEFLGRLLLSQAKYAKDCGFHLGPSGPGKALFGRGATIGLYLHRVPCLNDHRESPAAERSRRTAPKRHRKLAVVAPNTRLQPTAPNGTMRRRG